MKVKLLTIILSSIILLYSVTSLAIDRKLEVIFTHYNTTNVSGYKLYHAYDPSMNDIILDQDCSEVTKINDYDYSMICSNIDIETFPAYFILKAFRTDGTVNTSVVISLDAPVGVVEGFVIVE